MKSEGGIRDRIEKLKIDIECFESAEKGTIGYKIAKNASKEIGILMWVLDE